MAPTETLAEQHFLTLDEPCRELGVTCALLTGSSSTTANSDIVVGTHALIQEGVDLPNLAVAVVDEQHRSASSSAGARRGPLAARPAHDRDADPAHARADGLRRPVRVRDRQAAGEPEADRDRVGDAGEEREAYARCASTSTRDGRRTSSAR
jgi:hypothetical protein